MRSTQLPALLAIIVAGTAACAAPASARPVHHRSSIRHVGQAARVEQGPVEQKSVAVPPYERDGVPGNLPFNNQLRKFSEPLSANGR